MKKNGPINTIRLILILTGVLILIQFILILAGLDAQTRLVMIDFAIVVIGVVSTSILGYTAWKVRKHSLRLAGIWGITAAAVLFWTLGDLHWAILEVFLKIEPFPSIADVYYLLYYPTSILALSLLPSPKRTRSELVKLAMDIAIVFTSVGIIYGTFIIGPFLEEPDFQSIEWVISLAYPVLDLALLFGMMFIVIRPYDRLNNLPFLLLALTMITQVLTDTVYTHQTLLDTFQSGTLLDLGWQIGIGSYGVAGLVLLHSFTNPEAAGRKAEHRIAQLVSNRFWAVVPYLWMMAVYALLAWSVNEPLVLSPKQLVPWIGIIFFLVVGRQLLVLAENSRLSRELRTELDVRTQINQALAESEARYRAIVEDQTELLCRYLPGGKITFVNEAYCRYFGKTREELIGHSFLPLIPEEDQTNAWSGIEKLSPEMPVTMTEHRVILDDGRIRWQQWTDRAIFNDSGELFEYAAVGRDITERKEAEEALARRARELSALYDIAIEINAQLEVPVLLRSVLRRAAELLEAPMGALFLLQPNGESLRLEVNYNLPEKFNGQVMALGEGCAGTIAAERRHLSIDDFSTWKGKSPICSDLPLRRMVGVPLKVGDTLQGVILILDDRITGAFSENEVLLLSLFADQAAIALENARLFQRAQDEIRERMRMEAELQQTNEQLEQRVEQRTMQLSQTNSQLRASLNEKEMLLKEIHHRVKNNLQVISSLLSLQMGQNADARAMDALRESQNRVRSMALIHEKIYQSKDLAQVNFGEYIQSLAHYLFGSYRASTAQVGIKIEVEAVELGVDTAVPCGLILNELISNALKHAFPNKRSGEICISMKRIDGQIHLMIEDNGVGLPEEMDLENTSSLGLQLVTTLVEQLDGSVTFDRQPGARFFIQFPA